MCIYIYIYVCVCVCYINIYNTDPDLKKRCLYGRVYSTHSKIPKYSQS